MPTRIINLLKILREHRLVHILADGCCWMPEGEDEPRTTGEMKWGEDDVVPLVVREEAANSGNEG